MIQLMVEDLGAWWLHLESLNLPATYGIASPQPPATQP
jgi:hypothetical protein